MGSIAERLAKQALGSICSYADACLVLDQYVDRWTRSCSLDRGQLLHDLAPRECWNSRRNR